MRRSSRIGLVTLALLALVQVIPVERTNPPVTQDVGAPEDTQSLLRRACYDCHSNQTIWPWYSRVAPASWLVAHDVEDGRTELNFSTWDVYDPARKRKQLRATAEEVDEGEMPPWYYRLLHPEARLDAEDRLRLRAWTAAEMAALGR